MLHHGGNERGSTYHHGCACSRYTDAVVCCFAVYVVQKRSGGEDVRF